MSKYHNDNTIYNNHNVGNKINGKFWLNNLEDLK